MPVSGRAPRGTIACEHGRTARRCGRVARTRRRVALKRGPELTERDWRALHHFYRDTCGRKGSHPYLTRRFFEAAHEIAVGASATGLRKAKFDLDRTLDRIFTNRWLGFPLMLFMLAAVFWITIAGANVPSRMLGVLLIDTLHPILSNFGATIGLPGWLNGLLFDGIYLATAWVIAVMLPPMAIFFPLFTILEECLPDEVRLEMIQPVSTVDGVRVSLSAASASGDAATTLSAEYTQANRWSPDGREVYFSVWDLDTRQSRIGIVGAIAVEVLELVPVNRA